MKIAVCAKQVPDTEVKIEIQDGKIVDQDFTYIVNPYDEFAIEEALRIKEAQGDGEVIVFTIGGERAKEAVRTCLAMGADKAVLLNDQLFEETDADGRALALSKAIGNGDFDLVICGKQAVDLNDGQTGIRLAEKLGIAHAGSVNKLEWTDDYSSFKAYRDIEGGTEVLNASIPAVIVAEKGLNEPRYASLRGIMMAKRKPIEEMDAAGLGFTEEDLEPKIILVGVSKPPERKAGTTVSGDADESVSQLLDFLKNEAKIL